MLSIVRKVKQFLYTIEIDIYTIHLNFIIANFYSIIM